MDERECENCKKLQLEVTNLKKTVGGLKSLSQMRMSDLLKMQKEKKRIEDEYKKIAQPISQLKAVKYQAQKTLEARRKEIELIKGTQDGLDQGNTSKKKS